MPKQVRSLLILLERRSQPSRGNKKGLALRKLPERCLVRGKCKNNLSVQFLIPAHLQPVVFRPVRGGWNLRHRLGPCFDRRFRIPVELAVCLLQERVARAVLQLESDLRGLWLRSDGMRPCSSRGKIGASTPENSSTLRQCELRAQNRRIRVETNR